MKRKDIVKTINNLTGAAGHKEVLKIYNSQKKLPRGYEVKWHDAWCATTVSAVFLMNGCDIFTECSCVQMVEKAKKAGIWNENDAYIPKEGDVVMYDWQDTGKGDDKGAPDHVGIVVEVKSQTFVVREGNKNNTIGNRTMKFNAPKIRGFILPKYEPETAQKKKSNEEVAREVIEGIWGTGEARKQKLKAAGYSYTKIQDVVNELMKKGGKKS